MAAELATKELKANRRLAGLWQLAAGFRRLLLFANLGIGIASLARAASYLLLGYLIDVVLQRQDLRRVLPWVAAGFIGLAVMQGGLTYLSGRLAARSAEGIAKRLREYVFDHLQRLSFAYHAQARTGDLVQRSTSDVDAIRRFFADQAINAGRILLMFLINLAVLIRLDAQLALLSVVVVPLTVTMSYLFFRRISKAYEEYQEQEAVLSAALQENLAGVRVVKAFARQEFERGKFETENWERFLRGRRLLVMHSLHWPISDILSGLQMLFGLTLGALMVMDGRISIGTYLAYSGLIIWIIWPIRNLGRLVVEMSSGFGSYARVAEILREPREPLDEGSYFPSTPPNGELVFERVGFAYPDGGGEVLEDIDLHVLPGQVIALLGPTGSGKTSLVNLLPRFYDYTSGSLRLDGVELKAYPRRYLRRHIGIVEQEPFLFSRTIRENIAYGVGREIGTEELEAAAKAAAIHDVILGFPDGYDTLVGERGVTLSGGQKQRVAIARTLLMDPRILILDDSTSSVDPETEALIRTALERLMEGRTSFIIAHRVQSLMIADQILVLQGGRVVQRGNHDDLVAEEGLYRQIHAAQTRIEVELERELVSG